MPVRASITLELEMEVIPNNLGDGWFLKRNLECYYLKEGGNFLDGNHQICCILLSKSTNREDQLVG